MENSGMKELSSALSGRSRWVICLFSFTLL